MHNKNEILSIGFIKIRGQTGLTSAKQAQTQSFLVKQEIDILHLQEINICDDSFSTCDVICSSYNIISNNAPSKYGTASLIKTDFIPENVLLDSNGRVIVFNVGPLTLGNLYLPSGTDSTSKSKREQYLSETVPKLLLNRLDAGCIGGDLNCITDRKDCTHNPASKTSLSLTKMVKTFDMKDSYRELYPNNLVYSHYYHSIQLGEGATRIDIRIVETKYEPIAFSDHMAYVVHLSIPDQDLSLKSNQS